MATGDYKEYYKNLTIQQAYLLEEFNELTGEEIGRLYERNYKLLKENLPNYIKNIEKQAYQITLGLRPQYAYELPHFRKEYIIDRLTPLSKKYAEVRRLLIDYKFDIINDNQLSDALQEFRETNADYLGMNYGRRS